MGGFLPSNWDAPPSSPRKGSNGGFACLLSSGFDSQRVVTTGAQSRRVATQCTIKRYRKMPGVSGKTSENSARKFAAPGNLGTSHWLWVISCQLLEEYQEVRPLKKMLHLGPA